MRKGKILSVMLLIILFSTPLSEITTLNGTQKVLWHGLDTEDVTEYRRWRNCGRKSLCSH